MVRQAIHLTYRTARRIAVAVIGASVVAVGVAMIVLPGPAFLVIPAGLAILSIEFAFARRWLHHIRDHGFAAVNRVRGLRGPARPARAPRARVSFPQG
jgi:tellurite resistance protein TerC